ncbi:hypothetical protein VEx25_0455 [Vibrio antiquarius]|uniref:Uncharacterized protein n=1 Tax=Vibrio antiquarius (strain Ex25) TaxID=150340 RepID=A0ABM9WWC4_VIBAE|nr:hypothetical protein VEx25_0455 [Vibrio antiquarius]
MLSKPKLKGKYLSAQCLSKMVKLSLRGGIALLVLMTLPHMLRFKHCVKQAKR